MDSESYYHGVRTSMGRWVIRTNDETPKVGDLIRSYRGEVAEILWVQSPPKLPSGSDLLLRAARFDFVDGMWRCN